MIDILFLTGNFIEKNGTNYNWSEILKNNDIDDSVILTRRAYLSQSFYSVSSELLHQDFEIRPAEDEDYSLAIDVISEASNSVQKRTFVVPCCQTDIRPLLKRLLDKCNIIVLANKSAPPDASLLCYKWIDLSQTATESSDSESNESEPAEDNDAYSKSEPKGVLEPNEVFWKDKISKSLPSFVQARNGVVDVSDVVQWLYSLQFDVDINSIQPEQVAADVRGKALLKQCLPAAYIWEEAPGIPTRIKDSRIKEIQTVSAAEAISMLQLGSKVSSPDAPPTIEYNLAAAAGTSTDINHIITGADLMVHHCRWSVQREELIRQKADYQTEIAPMDNDFIRQGKEEKILIWTINSPLGSDEAYNRMEKCYQTILVAFRFLKQVEESCPEGMDGRNLFGRVAQLAADAQCILKTELRVQGKEVTKDPVQTEAFRYLRELGNKEHFYLYNIKSQDEIPLDRADDLVSEITMLQEQYYSINSESKQKKNLQGKLSYHAKQLLNGSDPIEQWEKIIATATELSVDYSMPPSDLFFRQQLEGVIDTLPEDLEISDEFGRIVQEIEIHQARVRESEELEAFGSLLPEDVLSPAVEKVREMYAGSIMVFIGGEPKEHIIKRIEDRFNVKLIWNSTNHSESLNRFDGELSDPDVSLFLIYIPWCSHKHSEELSQIVQRAGKKFVRLRKGTNPDIIAEAICAQTDKSEM